MLRVLCSGQCMLRVLCSVHTLRVEGEGSQLAVLGVFGTAVALVMRDCGVSGGASAFGRGRCLCSLHLLGLCDMHMLASPTPGALLRRHNISPVCLQNYAL